MANDGKIYITISDTRGGSGAGVSSDADKKEKEKQTLTDFAKHKFFNMIESEAKTFVNYTIGNIGNFTGNYQMQRDVQATMSTLGFLTNLATSAYVGAKAGGWIGALITTSVTLVGEGINFGLKEKNEQLQNKRTNRNLSIMRERLGLEGLTNGGRTGNQ